MRSPALYRAAQEGEQVQDAKSIVCENAVHAFQLCQSGDHAWFPGEVASCLVLLGSVLIRWLTHTYVT